MAKTFFFLFIFFNFLVNGAQSLYCQSNASASLDGTTIDTPLNDFQTALSLALASPNANILYLLPSSLDYTLVGPLNITQSLVVSAYYSGNTIINLFLEMSLSVYVMPNFKLTLLGLFISRKSANSVTGGFLFWVSNGAINLNVSTISALNIAFISGNSCSITISDCQILDLSIENEFISVTNPNSVVLFQNTIISEVESLSSNSYFINVVDSALKFSNVSITYISLTAVPLFNFGQVSKNTLFINFSMCYLANIVSSSPYILYYMNNLIANITYSDIYFFNNTVTIDRADFFFIDNGDFINIIFMNITLHNNFAIFIETYYVNSYSFTNFLVWDHNMRPGTNQMPFNPNFFSYVESTMYLSFTNFTVNGSYSDRDVAGPKFHINNAMYSRNGGISLTLVSPPNKIYVNFTDCLFTRTSSINGFWMDSGSAISFHSDLPLYAYMIRVYIIGNANDKGSTCMESYGQGNLKWTILDSFFINNSAKAGSSCLSMYVVYLHIKNSSFWGNALVGNPQKIKDFGQGTLGGSIYGETDYIFFENCTFQNNAAYQGGVFYFYVMNIQVMNLTIVGCQFLDNRANLGGVFSIQNVYHKINLTINNSIFSNNQAFNGGCYYLAFTSPSSDILLSNNSYISNAALKGGVSYLSIEGFQAVMMQNIYDSNYAFNFTYLQVLAYGGVHYFSDQAANDIFSFQNTYLNNTSSDVGGVYAINRGILTEISASFKEDSSGNQAATIYIRNSGSCIISDSVFEGETSGIWGGAVYICENSQLVVQNSSFFGCFSRSGGVFYFENYNNVTIQQCSFNNNSAYEGGVAVIDSSSFNMTISDCEFLSHPAQKYLFLLTSIQGFIKFVGLNFVSNTCPLVEMQNSMLVWMDSTVEYQNCNSASTSSACIADIVESVLIIQELSITETTLNIQGSLFSSLASNSFSIKQTKISQIHGVSQMGCGEITTTSFMLTDSSFENIGCGCFYFGSSNASVVNSMFSNPNGSGECGSIFDRTEYGSFISIMNGEIFMINDSWFMENNQKIALTGGAIKARNGLLNDSLVTMNNCSFINNSAENEGGALYFYYQKFLITNCTFEDNSAGTGGAIYFESNLQEDISKRYIYNNTFISNEADLEGGAIYFYDNLTLLTDNVFENNSAIYGNDLASYPVYLRFRIYNVSNFTRSTSSQIDLSLLNDTLLLFDSFNSNVADFILDEYPTGQAVPLVLVFELLDFYFAPIVSVNNGLGHLNVITGNVLNRTIKLNEKAKKDPTLNSTYDFNNTKVTIQGDINCYNQNGTFFFSYLNIYGTPGSYIDILISNDQLTQYFPEIIGNNITFLKVNGTIGLVLTFHLRACVIGEIYLEDINYCSLCPVGRYSLDNHDATCAECPNYATCLGGNVISIQSGYWRTSDDTTVQIFECYEYQAACQGGVDVTNQCADGYKGPLCSVCKFNNSDPTLYTKLGKYCLICMNDGLNAFFLICLIIIFIVIVIILIRSNLKVTPASFISTNEDKHKPPNTSLLFKILVDHVQLLGITENIGFDVPSYLRMTSDVQSNSVYFFQQMLSFDCFVKNRNITDNADNTIMFMRVLLVALMPIFSIIVISSVFYIYHIKRPQYPTNKLLNQCVASVIVTVFLIQPTILNTMTNMIGCVSLGNESYVLADMSLICWSADHLLIVFVFAIPCLIVWIIFTPGYCLVKIAKHRKNLKQEDLVLKYGFLYNGFHQNSFYWGFVKFFQKVVIILIRLSNLDIPVKMLTLLAILILSVSYKKFKTAYVHDHINSLEFTSNIVTLITLFLSMYFLVGISEGGQVIVFILIFASNIYFLVYWIKALLISKKDAILSTVQRLTSNAKKLNSSKVIVPKPVMLSSKEEALSGPTSKDKSDRKVVWGKN